MADEAVGLLPGPAPAPTPAGAGARRLPLLAARPDTLPLAASAVAWVVLVAGGGHGAGGGHLAHGRSIFVMVVATMGPFAVPLVRTVASTSPWWRARRAVVVAFTAFVTTWLVVAVWMHVVVEAVTPGLIPAPVLAGALVGASAAAALRPGRARRVVRCGRPVPLRRDGRAADVDCLRAGLVAAWWCARLSAVPMLAMLAVPGRWWVMAGLTAIGLGERAWAPRGRGAVALAYVGMSLAVLVLA